MSEPYVLTADDILQNKYLRQDGALPGDKIQGNNLIREFSNEGDKREEGYVLTEEDIENNKYLQMDGAEPEDQIIDNKLHKKSHDDLVDKFVYGFWDKSVSFEAGLADILESWLPLGRFDFDFTNGFSYISPSKAYGKGFMEASTEERREMILRARERDLMQEWGTEMMRQDDGWITAGEVAGTILKSPSTLIPLGKTLKGVAATSGALGGSYSASEQYRTKGEIDPLETALYTGGAALLGSGIKLGLDKLASRAAQNTVNRVEKEIGRRVDDGELVEASDLGKISEELGLNVFKVEKAYKDIGRDPYIKLADPAKRELDNALTTDDTMLRRFTKGADRLFGSISTRLTNIDDHMGAQLRRHDVESARHTWEALEKVKPFIERMSKVQSNVKNDLDRLIQDGNFDAARKLMRQRVPDLEPHFDATLKVLDDLKIQLKQAGHEFDPIKNYFPRSINDYRKLKASMGKDESQVFSNARNMYASIKGINTEDLTPAMDEKIMEKIITGHKLISRPTKEGSVPQWVTDKGSVFTKHHMQRKLDTVPSHLRPFYDGSEISIQKYIRSSINSIEKNKFLNGGKLKNYYMVDGKKVRLSEGFLTNFELQGGITNLIAKRVRNGSLKSDAQEEVKDILNARFVHGEKGMNKSLGALRDIGYMSTIGNPISALTQLADLGTSGGLKGGINTAISFARSITGRQKVTVDDLGFLNNISAEFSDLSKFAKGVDFVFRKSGFRYVDRLGKNTWIEASYRKNMKLSRSAKGISELKEKYKPMFGDEFNVLIQDLKDGVMTDRVKTMMASELLDYQPVGLSEMSEAWLRNPNARIFYMLKSFSLKQWDVARREVYQNLKTKGKRAKGLKNLALLTTYLMAGNVGVRTIKDFALGKEVSPEDIPDEALWSWLGVYGINRYTAEKYFSQGRVSEGLTSTIMPAMPLLDAVTAGVIEPFEDDPNYGKALKGLPLVGPIAYYWIGGGIEKDAERRERRRREND